MLGLDIVILSNLFQWCDNTDMLGLDIVILSNLFQWCDNTVTC